MRLVPDEHVPRGELLISGENSNSPDEGLREDIESIRCRDRTMNFGANPKVAFRWRGIPMALASAGVISLVALLSFGGYGAAMILGRVRPLRNAYQFFSRAYDWLLDQLGKEVLQDSRDTPALRLMVSLSLSAIPTFLIQLVLGKPRLLLAIAFYISLYGLKFQRFVRIFSAKHLEAHRRKVLCGISGSSGGSSTELEIAFQNSTLSELKIPQASSMFHHSRLRGDPNLQSRMYAYLAM
jgi:hypothetical protein